MKIDLYNFFKYFDEKNPKHRAAVEQFELDLEKKATELIQDESNWVRIYRTPNTPPEPKGIVLNVPYYPQTDNYALPDSTCNSSACAMCLKYFKPGSLPSSARGDDHYLKKVLTEGNSTDHGVQTRVLESYGLKSSFHYDLGFDDLDRELKEGRPVVLGILHRGPESSPYGGGHMIVVIGKMENGDYLIHDPYGSIYDGYSGPVTNGRKVVYSRKMLEKRWTVKHPNDGWGRIFDVKKSDSSTSNETEYDIPERGVELIKEFEGFSSKAYYDPHTGLLPITIAYGSTRKIDGTPFHIGETMTKEEGEKLLIYQINKEFIPSLQKIPYWNEMNDKMKSAILDFAYNLGANFYGASGFNTITRVLREKKWDEVPAALELYRNPGSSVEAGLLRRRKREGLLWQEGLEDIGYK